MKKSFYISKVLPNGKIIQTTVGVIINGIEFRATDKCRKLYNQGNPINILKFHLN